LLGYSSINLHITALKTFKNLKNKAINAKPLPLFCTGNNHNCSYQVLSAAFITIQSSYFDIIQV